MWNAKSILEPPSRRAEQGKGEMTCAPQAHFTVQAGRQMSQLLYLTMDWDAEGRLQLAEAAQ